MPNDFHAKRSPQVRYAVAVLLFVIALLLRFVVMPVESGFPFITFFPAMIACFYLCGIGPGLVLVSLSAVTGYVIFSPPYWVFTHTFESDIGVGLFVIGACLVGGIINKLQDYAKRLNVTLAALRQSNARYDELVQRIPAGVYTLRMRPDGGFSFEYGSAKFCQMLGLENQAALRNAQAVHACIHPEDRVSLEECNRRIAHTLEPLRWEGRHRAGGETRWLRIESEPTPLSNGESRWDGVIIDITDRKRAEETLRESEFRWKFAIEGTGDGVWDWTPQTGEVKYSRLWKQMLGYDDGEILPTNQEWVDRIHPDDQAYVAATMQAYLAGEIDNYVVEYRLRCKDGSYKWILGRGMAVSRGENGTVLRMIGTHTDITERKQLEEKLQQQATTDDLTGIANRRHFLELAKFEIKRAARLQRLLAVALIDIDYFKQVNDQYGHAAGDQALIAFTDICRKNIREIDVLARFGGDEFVLLLPEISLRQAYVIVERIRHALDTQPIDVDGERIPLAISSGIAGLASESESLDALLERADQALYQAKEDGRNCVVML